jgi:hypothetical protein
MTMSAFGVEDGRISKANGRTGIPGSRDDDSGAGQVATGAALGGAALGGSRLRRSAQLRPVIQANDQKAAAAWKAHRSTEAINYTTKAEGAARGAKTLLRSGSKRAAIGAVGGAALLGLGSPRRNRDSQVAKGGAHAALTGKALRKLKKTQQAEIDLRARVAAMPSMQRQAAQSRALSSPRAKQFQSEQDALWNQAGR